jgi:hypothetical protein
MSDSESPHLRHEFVGMMFAITIGEVGLQTAGLVQAGNPIHYLPAYSHLLVATVLVAASWVGWSRSPSPGARSDVAAVFQLEFVVLLVDVFLVICYFILVRTVDFSKESAPRIDPSSKLAFWIVVIFAVYLGWDLITKGAIHFSDLKSKTNEKGEAWFRSSIKPWFKKYGVRLFPTIVCFILALILKALVSIANAPQMLAADLALLSLVLLFRALKDLASAWFVSASSPEKNLLDRARVPLIWSIVCSLGIIVGVSGVEGCWSLPGNVVHEIQAAEDNFPTSFHIF